MPNLESVLRAHRGSRCDAAASLGDTQRPRCAPGGRRPTTARAASPAPPRTVVADCSLSARLSPRPSSTSVHCHAPEDIEAPPAAVRGASRAAACAVTAGSLALSPPPYASPAPPQPPRPPPPPPSGRAPPRRPPGYALRLKLPGLAHGGARVSACRFDCEEPPPPPPPEAHRPGTAGSLSGCGEAWGGGSREQARRWGVVRSVVLSTPRAESIAAAAALRASGGCDYAPGAASAGGPACATPPRGNVSSLVEPGSGNLLRQLLLSWRSANVSYIRKRLQGTWFRYDVERRQRRHVIHPTGAPRRVWDATILCFVLWNAVVVPYDAAFAPAVSPERARSELLIDALFGLDILLNFATGHVDKTGRLQTDWRINAKRYLRKWFPLDLFSTLPFERIVAAASSDQGNRQLSLLAFLKTPRLLRMSRLLRMFDHTRGAGLVRLMRLVLVWTLVAHWVACGYYLLAIIQGGGAHSNWLQASFAAANLTPAQVPLFDRYSMAFSSSVLCLVGNGLTALNSGERLFNAIVSLLGALLQAVVIGNCAQVVAAMSATAQRHQARADAALETARYLNIPPHLCTRISAYFAFMGGCSHPGAEGLAHLAELSPPLHRDIVVHLYGDILRAVPLFRGLPSGLIAAAAARVVTRIYMPGELVFKNGELSREMYFVIHGTVEVLDPQGQRVSLLEDGAYFGELALLANVQRSSTVQTLTPCEICSFASAALAAVLDDFPDAEPLLRARAMQRLAALQPGGRGEGEVGGNEEAEEGAEGEVDRRCALRGLAPLLALSASKSARQAVGASEGEACAPRGGSSVFRGGRRRSLLASAVESEAQAHRSNSQVS